jgi:crotonobetainyl-CoA:carnitine CoA-transferase CaiB-like acyl-CoA transferase
LTSETTSSDISAYFTAVNWGKKSLALDITQPEQLALLYEHIKVADIVIASYKPGDAEKLKVDFQTLSKMNERLIYGHITGYGAEVPRVGYDAIIQAESGFMFMNGEKGGRPVKMPVALIDILAGHQLKEAILVALLNRCHTHKGAYLEVSLFDTAVASLANQAANYLVANAVPQRSGSEHPNIVPYGTIFTTKDQFDIVLAVGSDKQFECLCQVLHLAPDSRFVTNKLRVDHREELNNILRTEIQKHNRDHLLDQLQMLNVPAGAINNLEAVFKLPLAQKLLLEKDGIQGVKTFIAKGIDTVTNLSTPPHLGDMNFS